MAPVPVRRFEHFVFRAWLTVVVGVGLALVILCTAAVVRHAMLKGPLLSPRQTEIVVDIADYPSRAKAAVMEVTGMFTGKSYALVVNRKDVETPAWRRIFPAPTDGGYLLLSGVDPVGQKSTVRLIRIADGKLLARWTPNWSEILARSIKSPFSASVTLQTVRAIHPILLEDSDIIFNTYASMARVGLCSPKPVWVLGDVYHHSNERGADGNIWTPTIGGGGFADNKYLNEHMRDDAIAHISPDGRVLERISFARIMRQNGLEALLLGMQGQDFNADPIHLNEIAVAPSTTAFWQSGDLLISARHLSTLFLYRPSTGRIIWLKTGPWMNQHSAAFVDNHRISVLNNNVVASVPLADAFIEPSGTNQVMVFDFNTGEVTQPFEKLIHSAQPLTISEGRARVLPDGGLFFEESNNGRLMRFTRNGLLWSYVNDIDNKTIGTVAWSRYLSADEAAPALRAIAAKHCAVSR